MPKPKPIPQVPTASQRIYTQFEKNPMLWARYYFPHHFRSESPFFHMDVIKEACSNDFLAIAAPRESAKSTILLFAYPFHRICFKKKRFIVIVSNTFKKAAMALDTMKAEIRDNELIREFRIKVTKDAEGDSIIEQGGFETRIICKGAEQIGSIRGLKFGAYRPDLIIVDDIEDDEMVKSPERRMNLQKQFDEALVPAGEKGNCQYIIIGTILHDDSLLAKLVSKDYYTEYHKLFYRGLNKDRDTGKLVSLWDVKWTVPELEKLRKEKPHVFAKEIQNNPVAGELARFHEENFRYWKIENNQYILYSKDGTVTSKGYLRDCRAAIACDLAWSERRDADSTVLMPAYLTPQSDILIDTYITAKGMRPDAFAEHLFTMEARLRAITESPVPVGFEKAMLEKVTKWILKNEMRKRNHFLITKDLKWESDKITRIETVLQPRYSQHTIFHKRGMGDLEHQLLRFPSGKEDDIIDAGQGVIRLLQFPKAKRAQPEHEDMFNWWRKAANDYHKPPKKAYTFGRKNKIFEVPATKTFR